jgi:hypothetical protein
MSDKKAKEAVAEARASLATARISFDELEKLRCASRGPLPSLDVLSRLVGEPFDSDAVTSVVSSLGLRRRKPADGGAELIARQSGIALHLDSGGHIASITLFGDGDAGYSSWSGPLDHGLNLSSTIADVGRVMGPPAQRAQVGEVEEVRYHRDGLVVVFVVDDEAIAQVIVRRSSP